MKDCKASIPSSHSPFVISILDAPRDCTKYSLCTHLSGHSGPQELSSTTVFNRNQY